MTREEVIALLNEQYETCKRIYDCSADQRKNYPNVPQFMEALGMALTALRGPTRERVEKAWRAHWMVRLTASLKKWLWDNHGEIAPLIMLGHVELFTDEMKQKYLEWCQTEEGKKYLKGGSEYHEPN